MRRSILPAVLLAFAIPVSWAQVLDKPAATVKLTRSEIITVKQLQKQVTPLEAQAKRTLTPDERKLVLDGLIAKSLLEQASERDKVVVSDAELKAQVDQYKKTLSAQLTIGRDLTDGELQQYVVQTLGSTMDEFQKALKYQILLANYTRAKRKPMLDAVKAPTDSEVADFYSANKKNFFVDDMVNLSHIFIDTRPLSSKEDKDKASKRANDIARELKGGAAFGDLVMKYSEDAASKYKGGDIGTLSRADEQRKSLFGVDFVDEVFRMKKGETSGVLQSSIGYHIVQVTDRFDAKLLSIDDKIPPQNQLTVREYIRQYLSAQRQGKALSDAANDLVAELKKQAEIKTFMENLSW